MSKADEIELTKAETIIHDKICDFIDKHNNYITSRRNRGVLDE